MCKEARFDAHMIESDVTKDGQFSYREIFSYLSDGKYSSDFSKADKSALQKRAK